LAPEPSKTRVEVKYHISSEGDIMDCPNCGYENPDNTDFCLACNQTISSSRTDPKAQDSEGTKPSKKGLWEAALEESSKLPHRDDQAYKSRAVWKFARYTLTCLVVAILGLLLAYIDIYTPARIPFGWLLGLFLAVVGGFCFFFCAIGTIVITIKPTYACDYTDVFGVINKSINVLGEDLDLAIKKVKGLDDLSLQLVLPSHRDKLESFLRVVDETLRNMMGPEQRPYKAKVFEATPSSRANDRVVVGVAEIQLLKYEFGKQEPKKVPFANITLAAVKSNTENWYLTLPSLDNRASWINFLEQK
jgi:hypothetical protein